MSADPYLSRMFSDMTTWLLLERIFCRCEDVCECGWDDMEKEG